MAKHGGPISVNPRCDDDAPSLYQGVLRDRRLENIVLSNNNKNNNDDEFETVVASSHGRQAEEGLWLAGCWMDGCMAQTSDACCTYSSLYVYRRT